MDAQQTETVTTTAPNGATTPPAETPKEAPKEAKPAETEEAKRLKLEALAAARKTRELEAQLTKLREAQKAKEEAEAKRAKDAEELTRLAEEDPGAWVERLTGMSRADLAKRLGSKGAGPEVALQRELADLKKRLEERDRAEAEKAAQAEAAAREAATSNAYRAVLTAAKGSEELHAASVFMSANPRGAAAWVTSWAEREWPKVAEAEGLDATDASEAAKWAAKALQDQELARLKKFVQTPSIAKALGLAVQSQQPPASQGAKPAATIDGALAGSRSAAEPTDKPLTAADRDRLAEKAAERALIERLNGRKG